MTYYLNESDQITGPFSTVALNQRYVAGEITGDVLAYPADNGTEWKPLSTILPHIKPSAATIRQQQAVIRQQNIQRMKAAAAQPRPPQARPALQEIRRQNLNFTGWGLVVFGALLAAYFFFIYDTSVRTERQYITGYGSVGGERVHNQGLMQNRLLGGITGLVVTGIGAALIIANPSRTLK